MEIILELKNKTYQLKPNDTITYEDHEDEGYFFVESTNKIIIMNPTSYYLWKFITTACEKNDKEKTVIKENVLSNYLLKNFTFDGDETEALSKDIDTAIYYFIQEEIFYDKSR